MTVAEAQAEVRAVYRGGSIGQLVAGAIWLVSASLGTWVGKPQAIVMLCFGGALIYPITQLVLRVTGGPWALSRDNPLRALAMQIALTVPLTLPVAGAATLHNVAWFYPACMMIVGAHYLPFIFLYGMSQFGALAALMIAGGFTIGYLLPHEFALGGWIGGVAMALFGLLAGRSSPGAEV